MKNILIIMLVFLCSTTISAQRNNKVEAKAKSYAEKYERVGNELTISIVVDKIPMSRKAYASNIPASSLTSSQIIPRRKNAPAWSWMFRVRLRKPTPYPRSSANA